jgi:hypothetical protein
MCCINSSFTPVQRGQFRRPIPTHVNRTVGDVVRRLSEFITETAWQRHRIEFTGENP